MPEIQAFEKDEEKEKKELENVARNKYLSDVKHEIHTSLNTILGFSQLLLNDKSLGPQQKEKIHSINKNGKYLHTLVNNILDYSGFKTKDKSMYPTILNLRDVFWDLYKMFGRQCKEKGLSLNISIDGNVPVLIKADKHKIMQVLVNLISNAIKYTDKGRIQLKISIRNRKIIISVIDTGPGIPDKDFEEAFSDFQQIEMEHMKSEGSGPDLAICKRLAKSMNGELHLKDNKPGGYDFTFSFEYSPVKTALWELGKESSDDHGGKFQFSKIRVLVYAEKNSSEENLVTLLKSWGFNTRFSCCWTHFMEELNTWGPHLVVLESGLSKIEGDNLINVAIQMPHLALTSFIIFCNTSRNYKPIKAGDYTNIEFKEKPANVESLMQSIYKMLRIQIDPGKNKTETEVPVYHIDKCDLKQMPENLLTRLHYGLVTGNQYELNEIVKQLDTNNIILAKNLKAAIDNYDYEELLKLLDNRNG